MAAPVPVTVTTTATYLFTPAPGASVQLFNAGPGLAYIGGGPYGGTATAVVGTSCPFPPNSIMNIYGAYNYGVGTTTGAVANQAMTYFAITATGVTTINVTSDNA